ncbi:MAG: hypothetical protein DSY33_02005 [Archaeoglobus sp.]|nr:MAG: hypothetical protein DSY33_02005 [Archaeoglobus sp.]
MKSRLNIIFTAGVLLTLLTISAITASALSASNIDLIYYNTTTHKPVYEVQFLTVPLYYDTGKNPKLIVYGAGTSFNIQVTNYESNIGGIIVKLVNVYDGTERVIGSLNKSVPTKKFTISNLYPGYWKIVIVGTENLPVWDISNTSAPTNAGAHEIKIVGNPKLIVGLLNPSRNIAIGDRADILIKIAGLYGVTNVSVDVVGQHKLTYSKVLGNSNNTWILSIPTDKLGIGECKVFVKAMGITGSLTFNVVGVNVSAKFNQSTMRANVSGTNVSENASNVSTFNMTGKALNKTLNETIRKVSVSKNVSVNETNKTTNKTTTNKTVGKTVNRSVNKTRKVAKTPGFEALLAVAAVLIIALRRRH